MILDNFVQKSFQAVKRGYDSDLSKKLGIFKHPAIMISYREFRKIRGYILSAKLRSLYAQDKLNDVVLAGMTYQDLEYVKQYDVELFKKIAEKIYAINLCRIQNKASPIRIAFFCPDSALWSCSILYQLFNENKKFEPYVVVPGFNNGTPVTIRDTYSSTVVYFVQNGYRVIGVYDKNDEVANWDKIGVPDIRINLNPYSRELPTTFSVYNTPLTCLQIEIPYGFFVSKMNQASNLPSCQMAWASFCESYYRQEMLRKYSLLGDWNVHVSGYPKMDVFALPAQVFDEHCIWKLPFGNKMKKIIWAPHHSLYEDTVRFSTFPDNYLGLYQYAKAHLETISWIVKPHPLLRKSSVRYGLFKTESEFDAYMDMWDSLPNAKTVRHGPYADIFLSSDAIITDCGSFLAEYMYVHKPFILLTRPEQKDEYNEFALALTENYYQVRGDRMDDIGLVIESVILHGNDYLMPKREAFFKKYLDISQMTGGRSASEYIYEFIRDAVSH